MKILFLAIAVLFASISCTSRAPSNPGQATKASATPEVSVKSTPSPAPVSAIKAYRISGNIDEAVQKGDVCDASLPFTVPGTLKFEFTPTSPTKGNYTYSGPFHATGSGPYEIFDNGKMLVSGTGCIMGKCATYSHDWTATPIDPKTCGK